MPKSCHSSLDPVKRGGHFTVALAGNPNSGKTTLFNGLTGLRQKVANYPGVTVEKKTGRAKLNDGRLIDVIDLPGTYSLISRSPDELVAMEILRGLRKDVALPDVVLVVVDASNLQRNLYLVSQLIELGRPLVVALNMMDVAERRGTPVSPEALSRELGVPVIPVIGHKRQGIKEVKDALANARVAPLPDFGLPLAMQEELSLVGGGLAILDSQEAAQNPPAIRTEESSRLGEPVPPRSWICLGPDDTRRLDRYQALAERLLIGDRAADVSALADREPVRSLLGSASDRLGRMGIDPMQADIEAHYQWIDGVAQRTMLAPPKPVERILPGDGSVIPYNPPQPKQHLTERVDAILIHKVWGLLIFALIMGLLFVSIFWLAQPIMDFLQNGINSLGEIVSAWLGHGPLHDLVNDGIFKGVGTVIAFTPQIAILFLFLAILEDSGYLARAAFLMDRLLAKVGLHGKSFIPLLSSFACCIPGIMATRTIESRKDRLATIFVAPFMSCSARLPVYTLLIGTLFAARGALFQALLMLGLYSLGIVAAAGTAWIFKRSLLKGSPPAFILELPTYKIPQLSQVLRQMWTNTWAFLTKAGTTIFCLSILLWALAYYPRLSAERVDAVRHDAEPAAKIAAYQAIQNQNWVVHSSTIRIPEQLTSEQTAAVDEQLRVSDQIRKIYDERLDHAVDAVQSEYSFAGRLGHAMEPVIKPLGFNWKMGVGLVGAFAAREVFISTMGIIYSVGEVEDDTGDLKTAMQNDRYSNGQPVWTPLVGISLLVWFVLAMQCMSTFAIVRRETGTWSWPIFMVIYMNALAYVACLLVFQVGRLV